MNDLFIIRNDNELQYLTNQLCKSNINLYEHYKIKMNMCDYLLHNTTKIKPNINYNETKRCLFINCIHNNISNEFMICENK